VAHGGVVAVGIIILVIAIIAFFWSIPNSGFTIPQAYDLCTSDLMQWALLYGDDSEARQACNIIAMMAFAIYGSGLLGIILIIVGAVTGGHSNEEKIYDTETGKTKYLSKEDNSLEILKSRYAKGEITKEEFEAMKKEKLEEKDTSSPLDILKQRYSRLEITRDEYEEKKKDLENS